MRRKRRVYSSRGDSPLRLKFGTGRDLKQSASAVQRSRRVPLSATDSSASSRVLGSPVSAATQSVLPIFRLRQRLRVLSCVLAVVHLLLSILGYIVTVYLSSSHSPTIPIILSTCTAVLTVGEVLAVVCYWQLCCRLSDLQSTALRVDHMSAASIWEAPGFLWPCVLEVAGHLLVPYPGLDLGQSVYTVNNCLFVAVILRNYHLLRVLYWYSPFSHFRTFMYARLTTVTMNSRFIFKCYLQEYGLLLVGGIYGLVAVLLGLTTSVLEQTSSPSVWSGFWTVAYTQSTVGYGVNPPETLGAQLAAVVCAFSGIFLIGLISANRVRQTNLRLNEFLICAELMNGKYKRKHMEVIARAIQSWWRLMRSRAKKQSNASVVFSFFHDLRRLRQLLVHCSQINAGLFANQAACFHTQVHTRIHQMNEYLYVLRPASDLVRDRQTLDLIRNEYKITALAKKVRKTARRQTQQEGSYSPGSPSREDCESPLRFSPLSSKSTRHFAKARQAALQCAKQRLTRQKTFLV